MYMKVIVTILILSLFLGEGLKSSPIYCSDVLKVSFVSNKDTLIGYLSKPCNKKSFPIIIVLHSASQGNHDNLIYNHLERCMNEIGIGVFTFDRRGSGLSQGNFQSASLENLAEDALSAIDFLKKRNDFMVDKFGLFGISQGGWIAPIVYTLNQEDISFMILVSSSGVTPAKQMEYSAITTLKINGYSDSIVEEAKHLRHITNEYYRNRRGIEVTQKEIDKYKKETWFDDLYLPWSGNLPEDVGITKWIHEMDFDPKKYFNKIDIPIALIYGETDRWVPIEESIGVWQACLGFSHNQHFDFFRIPNAGHMMIEGEYNSPDQESISLVYENKIVDWVSNLFK